jgi:hypothetical protein
MQITAFRKVVTLVVGIALLAVVVLAARYGAGVGGAGSSPTVAQDSGVVGTVVVSGGPAPGNLAGPGPIDLTVTAAGTVIVSRTVQSGTTFRIALPPGKYEISGLDGNAPCISATADVAAGNFTSVTVTCSIR